MADACWLILFALPGWIGKKGGEGRVGCAGPSSHQTLTIRHLGAVLLATEATGGRWSAKAKAEAIHERGAGCQGTRHWLFRCGYVVAAPLWPG